MMALDVHIVSHTHWDREWYLPFEQFRLRLVALVDRLLDMLESQPDFRYFHLDGQTIVLEDYLELRPAQEVRLKRLIQEGRILIGPWYDMPDEFLVSAESLVRNLARGHRVARRFGAPMPVGYLPDLFGHVSQMPQILRNFGLDNAILWRGFSGRRAEYWWESPDGSRVLMMHLPPEGYCNATRLHFNPQLMIDRASKAVDLEAARSTVGQVLLMNGVDHVEPHPVIPELTRRLSSAVGANVMHSTLPAYVDAVRSAVQRGGPDVQLEVIAGELRGGEDYANLLPGVLSARMYLKQANAGVQTLLERWAEPVAAFASMLGAPYPEEELRYAWKTLLQNHPHDSICGCSVDGVHEENMTRFARARQVAEGVRDTAIAAIVRSIPAGDPAVWRCIAINTNAEPFAGTIEATIELPFENGEPHRQVDPEALDAPVRFVPVNAKITAVRTHDGQVVPVQVIGEEFVTSFVMSRYETPWALRARRVTMLWHGKVPAFGYAAFDLMIDGSEVPPVRSFKPVGAADRSAENEFLRLLVNDDGTVDVVDRRTGTRHTRCGEFEDVGDVGDEYNYSPPASNPRVTSADASDARITRVHAGPMRAAFRIDITLPIPEAASPDRSSRSPHRVGNRVSLIVSLDAGSPRVTWDVVVDNRSRDHRLRMLFPAGAETLADLRAETAFGVVRRPARREVPRQVRNELPVSYGPTISFVDAGEAKGATVFGIGLAEYEAYPRDDTTGPRIGLTLLRCVGDLSRDDLATRPSGHAGPGLPTPGAQCPGVHQFRLAFEPRGGEPPAAALFARSAAFVNPPRVVSAAGAAGSAAAAASFITIEAPRGGAVLSACKRAEERDSLIVRLFNPDEAPATVRLRAQIPVRSAALVDFMEERPQDLPVRDGVVEVILGRHQIRTIELNLGR
jgi:mannosylglycerate hydrolase